jgi:hypothetical protein
MLDSSTKFRTEYQQILGSDLDDRRPYVESVSCENAGGLH